MRYFLFLFLIIVFLSCNNDGKNGNAPSGDSAADYSSTDVNKPVSSSRFIYRFADSILEARINDTLMKLPFVQKSNNYIDSFSNHQHGIAFMSDSTGNIISVMAGYNGPERFESYYHFRINPKTFEIKILDPLSGNYISTDEYLKNNPE